MKNKNLKNLIICKNESNFGWCRLHPFLGLKKMPKNDFDCEDWDLQFQMALDDQDLKDHTCTFLCTNFESKISI